ncbi:MAG: hypothetical protein CME24_06740 [Gemmatimonadetes bacterium]|nr:hypothetical protein [Gemmatimonadota bacterium]
MNGTTGTSTATLAAMRDAEARRRNGLPAATAAQRATVEAADLMVEVVKSARLVAVEAFEKGRVCTAVTVTVDEDGTATTDECTTVLSIYNEGPQCHRCDAKNPQDVDSLIG